MAVLIEAISVVIRCDAMMTLYAGGQAAFMQDVPNASLRADGSLAAVSCMVPDDVRAYVDLLESRGLTYIADDRAVNIVVVDQTTGLRAVCDWVQIGQSDLDDVAGRTIVVCQLAGEPWSQIVMPQGWQYDTSLSARARYVPGQEVPAHLELLDVTDGVERYRDRNTGEILYRGRTVEQ